MRKTSMLLGCFCAFLLSFFLSGLILVGTGCGETRKAVKTIVHTVEQPLTVPTTPPKNVSDAEQRVHALEQELVKSKAHDKLIAGELGSAKHDLTQARLASTRAALFALMTISAIGMVLCVGAWFFLHSKWFLVGASACLGMIGSCFLIASVLDHPFIAGGAMLLLIGVVMLLKEREHWNTRQAADAAIQLVDKLKPSLDKVMTTADRKALLAKETAKARVWIDRRRKRLGL